nr:protein EMSY-LIKE 1-like isoform X1 [Tanacetum cinerariifolium]
GDHRFMHGQAMDWEVAPRTIQYGSYQYGRSDGTAMARGSITATDNQPEEYVDII